MLLAGSNALAEGPQFALQSAGLIPLTESPAKCVDDVETYEYTYTENIFGNENKCLAEKGLAQPVLLPAEVEKYESALQFKKRKTPLSTRNDLKSLQINDFFKTWPTAVIISFHAALTLSPLIYKTLK